MQEHGHKDMHKAQHTNHTYEKCRSTYANYIDIHMHKAFYMDYMYEEHSTYTSTYTHKAFHMNYVNGGCRSVNTHTQTVFHMNFVHKLCRMYTHPHKPYIQTRQCKIL